MESGPKGVRILQDIDQMGDVSVVPQTRYFIGLQNAIGQKPDKRAKTLKFPTGYWSNYVSMETSLVSFKGLSPITFPPSPHWTSESRASYSTGKA